MKKRTKIVATISDHRCEVEFLKQLYRRGMNVVRLNTAHQEIAGTLKVIKNVRKVSDRIPLLLDTKGPEIRTTEIDKSIKVQKGDFITIKGGADKKSTREVLYVSYNKFAEEVPVGSHILIDDGELELIVKEVKKDALFCEVQSKSEIKGNKSVNVPCVPINLPSLSPKDIDYIHFAIENNIDFIAHSFVRTSKDIADIQKILDEHNSSIKIIAKIESQTGVDNIEDILDHAYGIMVARGDLGIEIPSEKIPGIQASIVKRCVARKKPVIIATQMLHTMINNPRPTRAEVSDIAAAVYQGTDAIMLSGETAYGNYPLEAVETMAKVAHEIEESKEYKKAVHDIPVNIDDKIAVFLAKSAFRASRSFPTKAVVLDTLSGRTARYMSAFRGHNNVYAICYNKRVMRELGLSYGVCANYMEKRSSTDIFRKEAISFLYNNYNFSQDDLIILLGGSFGAHQGATFIEMKSVSAFMYPDKEE